LMLLGLTPTVFLIAGTGAYFFQLSLFFGGRDNKEYEFRKDDKQKLLMYAEKTYKYFQLMSTPSGIIGDNIQIKPYKGQSRSTSPTNICFTMLADIAAYYLGFIDKKKAAELISNRLRSLDIMPKWKGNLYNWYNIDSFQPVNKFISSVDSGNFVAALMITKEFLKVINENSASSLATKLINNTNLEALYDHEKGQFFIGYNESLNEYSGHYDILESEARLLSLIFIAKSGKVEHWRNLQRDYSPVLGNTLLSWSGTMFEYLMSDHFVEPPRFSLLHSSSRNAAQVQANTRFKGVWGVSESGHYAFDDELRYQYYAFGLNKLSLRSEFDKGVVSPYSSALALKYFKNEALQNLSKIDAEGGLGDYGFYEAIDLSGRPRFISSYMTHHQGMILTALANSLEQNVFCRLMSYNACMRGAINLLNELKSEYSYTLKHRKENLPAIRDKEEYFENVSNVEYRPKAAALTNGTLSVCVDTLGNNFLRCENIYVNAYRRLYGQPNGGYFYVLDAEGNMSSPSYFPLCDDINDHCLSYSAVEITLQNTRKGIKTDICVADGIDAEVRRLTVGQELRNARVGYYMDIGLNTYDGFNAHPVFNNLFVSTDYDEENKAIIMHKKSLKKDGDIFAAFVIRGLTDIKVETNRFNLLGRNGSEKMPRFYDTAEKEYASIGDVLEPAVGFSGTFSENNGECQLITLVAKSRDELNAGIRMLPEDFYRYAKESSRMKMKIAPIANRLLGNLLYTPYPNKTLLSVWKNRQTNEFREITNYKKSIIYMYDDTKNQYFEELLQAVRQWKTLGIAVRLIIYYSENFKETQKQHIKEQLKSHYVDDYLLAEKAGNSSKMFDWAFAVLDSSLSVIETKPLGNVLRDIEIKESAHPVGAFENDCPDSTLKSGNGHFCNDSYVLMDRPALPYSNVICDKYGGMVITENHGGFFYFNNSREFKACDFEFDPVKDKPYEYILSKEDRSYLRINGGSGKNRKTVYGKGMLEHFCYTDNFDFATSSYIIYEGRVKVTEVLIESKGHGHTDLIYTMQPSLGWKADRDFVAMETEGNIITIYNIQNGNKLYLKAICSGDETAEGYSDNQEQPYFEITGISTFPFRVFFVASTDAVLLNSLNSKIILQTKQESLDVFNNLSNISISSPVKSFNYIAGNLLYQVYSSRLNGKCGYYQSGGATGFRDQLQDSLAFLHSRPEITKNQILYSAIHQYEEGDVMHWWHHPNFGLRTKITDDKLYLPYVTSLYVQFTGDVAILDTELEYLKSTPLSNGEHSRLENPPHTDYKENLMQHCVRAIKSTLRFGEHNLLLLGGGDWNDGLDYAGVEGKGESTALSMFCYEVIQSFQQLCDVETRNYLNETAAALKSSIETHCFEDSQYKRLFSDEGKWLGAKNTPHYSIDLVAQSFAVLCGIADGERRRCAMDSARRLVDEKLGIIKLLSPALTKDNYVGYISSYPEGTRENGGQYTHAAIWFIMALIKSGKAEEAYECFQMINPVEKCRHKDNNKMYKGEPFVLAGDVYSNKDNEGRMGWSWYTGSAAWAYRLIIEDFFGLTRRGDTLIIKPSLPKKLMGTELIYKYKRSEYVFEFVESSRDRLIVDGVEFEEFVILLEDKKRS
ncbi:MAG: glucoamylase family protein, partial [Clostridia bacterium]|nr:glucoamylase family protein [Clostridia bacterium]